MQRERLFFLYLFMLRFFHRPEKSSLISNFVVLVYCLTVRPLSDIFITCDIFVTLIEVVHINIVGVNAIFRTKLKEYRTESGISQAELAERVNVRRETISHLERGEYNPSLKLAYDIAAVFGVTIEEIFWYEEEIRK